MKESSMSVVETNVHFREHDIEFLQKRTKLWLETVLGETYGDRPLAELISDGNILFRVSKYITKELTGASPRLQEMSPKTFSQISTYGKTSGKYLPYANVDTFIKTCRKVGLTDVELFTPPDAVEGKDVRRVCTCIRSLARKARAQHIRVPDFEDVNRPLPMPKEKVGEIKENLQHATSTPVTPTVATPEADIQKSERVQIISRFLSATKTSPSSAAADPSDAPSPATPGPLKSLSASKSESWSSPSTPMATIGGIDTPTLPPAKPEDQVNDSPVSYSQKKLGSFRHAQPHFIKTPSVPTNLPDSAVDLPDEGATPDSKSGKMPSTPTVTTDQTKDLSSLSKLGSGGYRHAQPHFTMKKPSQADLSDSTSYPQDLQSKFSEAQPKANALKAKGPSSNKIVEKDMRVSMVHGELPVKSSSSSANKVGQGSIAPGKEPLNKAAAKSSGVQISAKLWMPLVAGALAFLGSLLLVRTRDPGVYQVKQGDTLSKISKHAGKSNWDELVKLNPGIANPNLIYPSDRLKIPL